MWTSNYLHSYERAEEVEVKVDRLGKSVKMAGEDVENDYNELQTVMEKLDNQNRRCNVWLVGLAEGVVAEHLDGYLKELFAGWTGSDSKVEIKLSHAYQVNSYRKKTEVPQDIWLFRDR